MNSLILGSLRNPYAVTVAVLSVLVIGGLALASVPIDIMPVYRSPGVQVLTFYGGMPAGEIENDISNRMERWTGQAAGTKAQESRSIVGASIIRNLYHDDVDPSAALTQVNSLASAAIPNLPPGTLPPVVLPYDPTSSVPACLVALDSGGKQSEAVMFDVGRYEVRNYIMGSPGAVAPVVYGGKVRAVLAYLDPIKLQARGLAPVDVMRAIDEYNLFLPAGDIRLGSVDYAIRSNSMFDLIDRMGSIPLRSEPGNATYLRDVATPKDSSFIQTNVVRVNGQRQVYIPVYRQVGASTLSVVNNLRDNLPDMQSRLSRPNIDLKVVMDQSVYVRHSITSLVTEGVLGAVLCSLVILLFLGEWRMTLIAILTIPIAVVAAILCLYATGNTINVMTLAGLALAIGPLVDLAIICLENTHRHLSLGASSQESALRGASEVAMPALVACCCTLLVLAPLALMPGLGRFLFRPMALAVAFAMLSALVLALSFVPTRCAHWLKAHLPKPEPETPPTDNPFADGNNHAATVATGGLFARWEATIAAGIAWYVGALQRVIKRPYLVLATAVGLLALVLAVLAPQLRREFFPEVDAGAFEVSLRAKTGTRIEVTETKVALFEALLRQTLDEDLETTISEIGVTPDWSAAYTPNAGPMDAIVKVQLKSERAHSAQEYVHMLREQLASDSRFHGIEFAFDAGGLVRAALNEGKSTPLNIRIAGKNLHTDRAIAEAILERVKTVDGVVDARILQRLDYPQYMIEVDRAKAADLGLNQDDVMKNVIAAMNSSIQFNKRNFWIDPITHNQYYVGVQYPEQDIKSIDTLLNVPITSPKQKQPIPLRNIVRITDDTAPAEISHVNLQPTIDLTMNVHGRDLGHVADDVYELLDEFGQSAGHGAWTPFDPYAKTEEGSHRPLQGFKITLTGEYSKMEDTFRHLGLGLILAALLIYFLLTALFKSYIRPLVVMSALPVGLIGVVLMLFLTGTAINLQSLLGVIFMVGIVVSNTVLLTDFAQKIQETEGLSPTEAICKAASVRVRPVVMTALAAFFALVPMAIAFERGSEANAPLGRAVIGGLLAGLVTTLFVVPVIYSLLIKGTQNGPRNGEQTADAAVESGSPT